MIYLPRKKEIREPTLAECHGLGLGLGFGGGGNSFSPLSLSNMRVWFRGDLLLTQSGNRVSAWGDSSGSGDANRNLVQATGSKQPLYVATSANFGNRPTIKNDDSVRFLASGTWGTSYSQPTTIYVCGVMPNAGRLVDGSGVANRQAILNTGAGKVGAYAGSAIIDSATSCTTPFVACCIFNGASTTLYVQDSQTAKVTANPGANALNIQGVFGLADSGAGGAVNDELAELLAYSGSHSASQRQSVFRYMASRYAIAGVT